MGASGLTSVVLVAVDGVWSLLIQRVLLLQSMACGRRGRSGENAALPAAMAPTTDTATALNRNMAAPRVQATTRTQKAASRANVQVTALTNQCQWLVAICQYVFQLKCDHTPFNISYFYACIIQQYPQLFLNLKNRDN